MVRGSNLGEGKFSLPIQTGPEAHTTSCTMGTGSLTEVKWQRHGSDHPPLPSAQVVNGHICISTQSVSLRHVIG
jgi:hypothetical protein